MCVLDVLGVCVCSYGTLHGGVTATVVDVVTTAALMTMGERAGVSVELNVLRVPSRPSQPFVRSQP